MHRWKTIIFLTLLIGLIYSIASAQTAPEPIGIGENRTGEVSVTTIAPTYSFSAAAGQSISLQVLAITGGFAPALRILDPVGAVAASVSNVEASNIIELTFTPTQPGIHLFEVQSANGAGGQFLIAVQAVQVTTVPPTPLPIGLEIPGSVNPQAPLLTYSFNASPTDVLLLTVTSSLPTGGPNVTLKDGLTGEVLGSGSLRLIGVRFRIPVGTSSYLVEVAHSNANPVETYTVLLEIEGSAELTATPTATVSGGATVNISPTGPCLVGATGTSNINVRSGASTDSPVVTQLGVGLTAPVIGRTADNTWYQVNVNGVTGWVAASVVVVGGQCGAVPVTGTGAQPVATTPPPPAATAEAEVTAEASATTETPTEETPTEETPTEETPTDEGVTTLDLDLIPNIEVSVIPELLVPLPGE